MKITEEQINKLADDLLIGLAKEENAMILEEFEAIEETMQKIANLPNISSISPMHHPFPVEVELREDKAEESIPTEILLRNAKDKTKEEIRLPKVVNS